ncbi:hypothetical protein LTR85_001908 [Meristemomyces frigidus]|nr:hypothetical protein LTR85_001908 [Meristemomyces frigidus]
MADTTSTLVQLRDFRSQVPPELLRKWEAPTGVRCTVKTVQDWAIILTAHQLFVRFPSILTFLDAMLLMSWGQRGLSTLAHDSVHGNLFRNRTRNDLIGDIFLAPAAMSTTSIPRQTHAAHHQYLGTEKDPDHGACNGTSLRHYQNGRYDHKSILLLWLYDVADPLAIKQDALGDVLEAPIFIISWWVAMNLLMSMFEPRSILAFGSLGPPWGSSFQKYLQPHDDNYHLLHHLLPKVPMSKLHEADAWLTDNVESYQQANHFDAYLVGQNPLFTQLLHEHGSEMPGCP